MRVYLAMIVVLLAAACTSETAETTAPTHTLADTAVVEPEVAKNADAFRMTIADVQKIAGGRVVVTGKIASGTASVGDTICINAAKVGKQEIDIAGMERLNKVIQSASAGEFVGLLVNGIALNDISAGDELSAAC